MSGLVLENKVALLTGAAGGMGSACALAFARAGALLAWTTLTYPPVLAETPWGSGRILIDLIPENRTVLLRALAYLTSL